MTCIVGWLEKGDVYLGGDSAGVSGYDVTVRKDPKVFKVGEFVIGFTTSFRMGQILMFKFNPSAPEENMTDYQYMCTTVIDHIRTIFKESGFGTTKDGTDLGGCFLIGYRGHLYKIASDYQVGEAIDPFEACGCGEDYAKGSLYALRDEELTPITRLKLALETAANFSTGVKAPFVVVSTLEVKA